MFGSLSGTIGQPFNRQRKAATQIPPIPASAARLSEHGPPGDRGGLVA